LADGMNRSVVLPAPMLVDIVETLKPSPGPGEVLVKVKASALCTWEQRVYKGAQQDSYPLLGGHEFAGIVEAVGPDVKEPIAVGDHVAVARIFRCGECRECRTGYDNLCANMREVRHPGLPFGPGGLSDYVVAPRYQVYKVADDLPFEEAALSEPVSCVVRSVERSGVDFGDPVVILGAGVMGLLHVQLAKRRGAKVIVSEPVAARRQKALELGADSVIDPTAGDPVAEVRRLTGGKGATCVFVAGGDGPAIEGAINMAAKGGRVVLYAAFYPVPEVHLDVNRIHHNEISIIGTMSQSKEDFLRATELLSSRAIDVRSLISKLVPFERVKEAFDAAIVPGTYRVVVTMD